MYIFLRYDELRSVSFEPGLIFVHALRAMEPVPSGTRTQFAHTRACFVWHQYYVIICYSSLTDSVNTTSNIAIPYDNFSS